LTSPQLRRRQWARELWIGAGAILTVGFPAGSQAADDPSAAAWTRLARADERAAAIAYRLSTANVAFCRQTGPQAGLVLHSLDQYSERMRAELISATGLDARPTVEAVVAGGPAARAGALPGDVFLAINGEVLESRGGVRPSAAVVISAKRRLNRALATGPALILVEREGRAVLVTLSATLGCAVEVTVTSSPKLGARTGPNRVEITLGLVEYAGSDDVLAMNLGHEFAHAIARQSQADRLSDRRDNGPAASYRREYDADATGLYLAARAGYDVRRAGDYWRRYAAGHVFTSLLSASHPAPVKRGRLLEPVVQAILADQQAGRPIVPPALSPPP